MFFSPSNLDFFFGNKKPDLQICFFSEKNPNLKEKKTKKKTQFFQISFFFKWTALMYVRVLTLRLYNRWTRSIRQELEQYMSNYRSYLLKFGPILNAELQQY